MQKTNDLFSILETCGLNKSESVEMIGQAIRSMLTEEKATPKTSKKYLNHFEQFVLALLTLSTDEDYPYGRKPKINDYIKVLPNRAATIWQPTHATNRRAVESFGELALLIKEALIAADNSHEAIDYILLAKGEEE